MSYRFIFNSIILLCAVFVYIVNVLFLFFVCLLVFFFIIFARLFCGIPSQCVLNTSYIYIPARPSAVALNILTRIRNILYIERMEWPHQYGSVWPIAALNGNQLVIVYAKYKARPSSVGRCHTCRGLSSIKYYAKEPKESAAVVVIVFFQYKSSLVSPNYFVFLVYTCRTKASCI